MAKSNMWSKVGVWAFLAGLLIAIIVALFSGTMTALTAGILAVLGIVVGLLNVADEEVHLFLLASLVFLVAAGSMATVGNLLPGVLAGWMTGFFAAIVVFMAPAAVIVSLVALYHIAKDK